MSKLDRSLKELLFNGKNWFYCCFLDFNAMVDSLNKHNVTLEEVESLKNEIKDTRLIFDHGGIVTLFSLFVTSASVYITSTSSNLVNMLSVKTSKMSKKEFSDYIGKVEDGVLAHLNWYANFLQLLSIVVLAILIIKIVLQISNVSPKQRQLKALFEYERKLFKEGERNKLPSVPTSNIDSLKESPMSVFELATKKQTGVYIFDHNTPSGVVMSVDDYEKMVSENERLLNEITELKASIRLNNATPDLVSDHKVRGKKALEEPTVDEDDGWE